MSSEQRCKMIVSIGEILTDRLISDGYAVDHIGGAPFNVAVHAKRCGADVLFFGRVGKDEDGDFIKKEGKKYLGEDIYLETDERRKTTVAEVTLLDGERSFRFVRKDAADYAFEKNTDFLKGKNPKIVHLGTLMLNTDSGREFFDYIADYCERQGILLSADANFRDGLFSSKGERNEVMSRFLHRCDIIKFSDEELSEITGESDLSRGIEKFSPKNLLFVTMGKKGSAAYHRNTGLVCCDGQPAEKVVDTTGAGDAFYGAVLAKVAECGKTALSEREFKDILMCGNANGREAVAREGAVW